MDGIVLHTPQGEQSCGSFATWLTGRSEGNQQGYPRGWSSEAFAGSHRGSLAPPGENDTNDLLLYISGTLVATLTSFCSFFFYFSTLQLLKHELHFYDTKVLVSLDL